MNVVGAVGLDAAVEHDHRLAGLAGPLDGRRHRRRRVGRDDEGVAVALGDEVVDVGDLGVVVVLGVAGLHLGDDALVLEHLELLVHGDPAGLPPRVGDRGVGEADLLGAVGLVLRGVGHLAVDVLQLRLLRVTLERRRALLRPARRSRAWTNHSSRSPASVSSSVARWRRCRPGRRPRGLGRRCCRRSGPPASGRDRERGPRMDFRRISCSPVFVPGRAWWWVQWCPPRVRWRSGRPAGTSARATPDRPRAGRGGDGEDDDHALHGVAPGRRDARKVSSVKSSSSAKAPAAAESTQPRPPPSTTPPRTTAVMAAELVAVADRGVHAGVPDEEDARRRWPTARRA